MKNGGSTIKFVNSELLYLKLTKNGNFDTLEDKKQIKKNINKQSTDTVRCLD